MHALALPSDTRYSILDLDTKYSLLDCSILGAQCLKFDSHLIFSICLLLDVRYIESDKKKKESRCRRYIKKMKEEIHKKNTQKKGRKKWKKKYKTKQK